MKPDENGKYVSKAVKFESLHLPHPDVVTTLLGLPSNLREMIPFLESMYGVELELKSSTRAKIFNGGVGKRSLLKLLNWFNALPIPFKDIFNISLFRKVFKASRAGSNAGEWLSVIQGMKKSPHDTELNVLLEFIEQRANIDTQVLGEYKKRVKTGEIDSSNVKVNWLNQQPYWSDLRAISNDVLSEYDKYVENSDNGQINSTVLFSLVMPCVVAMKFDFYLSAIAHYEIGLALYAQRNGDDIELASFKGHFSSMIHTYAVAEEYNTCFGAMLIELRDFLSNHGNEVSWRELASFIAIDESGDSGELLNNKQYKQLKDWRKGKNMPSSAKTKAFVEAAIASVGKYDVISRLIYFRIARGIDRLVEEYSQQAGGDRVLPIIAEVLASYPKYFEYYKRPFITA